METPNIDALASKGVMFWQGYSPNPVCASSRCAILNGNHAARAQKTRVVGGARYEESFRAPATLSSDTLATAVIPDGTTHHFPNIIDENQFLCSYPEIDRKKKRLSASAIEANLPQETLPPLINGIAPQTYGELWADFDPRSEPLDTEIVHEWEEDGVVMKIVRYRLGIFKGQKSMMAAVYGYPKGAEDLPRPLQIHGGGQYAHHGAVLTNANTATPPSLSLRPGESAPPTTKSAPTRSSFSGTARPMIQTTVAPPTPPDGLRVRKAIS